MKKTMKKITCGVLATVSLLGCVATMSACETDHPEVEITVDFNGGTYVLEYELYRNIAPATVNHFLFLAENGYYNGLTVHDYAAGSRLYTGMYTQKDAEGEDRLSYVPYYQTISSYGNYGAFPHSVWLNENKSQATYTLKGEFEANNFRVTNGAVKESFGALTMYYYGIENTAASDLDVYTVRASEDGKSNKSDYRYNHTTSAFAISLSSSTKTNNAYCTFATLHEDSVEVLQNLQSAITSYVSGLGEDEEFTESVTKTLFTDDEKLADYDVSYTFDVPKTPITIRSIKVTSY